MEQLTQVLEGAITSFFVGIVMILVLILIGYKLQKNVKKNKIQKKVKKHQSTSKKK